MTEASTPTDSARSQAGKIFTQVADYIERATRFDGNDVCATTPEIEADGFVSFKLQQQAHVSAKLKETRGRLPDFVDEVANHEAMQNTLRQRLAETNAKLPAAIENWASHDSGTYMRLLPSSIVTLPRGAGWEWECQPCHGAGRVSCPVYNCYQGRVECYTCHGSRQVSCGACSGNGKTICSSCYGSGSHTIYQNGQTVYQTCSSCYGSGKKSCYTCSTSGRVQCSTCWGSGDTQCSTCSGTSRVICSTCQGQRWLNEFGTFDIDINTHISDHKARAIDDSSAKTMTQIELHDLPAYGELIEHAHEGRPLSAYSTYTLRIPHQKASIQADNEVFTIYGFGKQARVFSYENIVGHLLHKDLQSLRTALSTGKKKHHTTQTNVLDRLADFTRSELNMVLAEELTNAKPSSDLHAAVEAQYHGIASQDYIAQASAAFKLAISRVYRAKVAEPAFSLMGIALMLSIILAVLGAPTSHWMSSALLSFFICGVLWVFAEIFAQRSIANHFEGALGKRVLTLSKQASNIKNWKRWMWLGMLISAFCGAFLVMHLDKVLQWLQNLLNSA